MKYLMTFIISLLFILKIGIDVTDDADPIIFEYTESGFKQNDVLSIGDENKDIISPKRTGTKTVYIFWEINTNISFSDCYFKTVRELVEFLA